MPDLTDDQPTDAAWDACMDEDWDLSLVAARWPEPLPWHGLDLYPLDRPWGIA